MRLLAESGIGNHAFITLLFFVSVSVKGVPRGSLGRAACYGAPLETEEERKEGQAEREDVVNPDGRSELLPGFCILKRARERSEPPEQEYSYAYSSRSVSSPPNPLRDSALMIAPDALACAEADERDTLAPRSSRPAIESLRSSRDPLLEERERRITRLPQIGRRSKNLVDGSIVSVIKKLADVRSGR